ncbi:MAG TPA: MBL fold metallo-hydrolase, partial [Terriglobales bacterium]|nr:MBL fold metallo-hydrolase [Terriglobales bacterium]
FLLASTTLLAQSGTHVVVLGTGTPRPDPDRSGGAVAVVSNGTAYLVDLGAGVIRRASAAAQQDHLPVLESPKLKIAFLTHLHSDHTLGYPDFILTPWVMGRTGAVNVYGPAGLQEMTQHLLEAWKKDIDIRIHGLEGKSAPPDIQVHEIKPGVVYKDANVTVTAFLVKHGSWDQSFGYRFDTPDRSIVISGDTSPTDAIAKACNGCDLLLHEMYDSSVVGGIAPEARYFAAFHTSPAGMATVANAARPKLLVLYHQMERDGDSAVLDALRAAGYKGAVVSAHDLDVY